MPDASDKQTTIPNADLFRPGTFGCHEALHVASILAENVDKSLCQHPAVVLNPAWEELAQKACDALHELYQAIGAAHL